MSDKNRKVTDIVVASNFIRAVRDSGYLNTSTALAELVDNSLQASATMISITIDRQAPGKRPEITVEDNGVGMTKSELEQCLQFGGSSRFDARQSFGRFGMGLPAASLSQARRVEVTAWRNFGAERTVVLDVDEIIAGSDPTLVTYLGSHGTESSGCRVRWLECDRIEYQRLAWLERSLHRDLGRMFRRHLSGDVLMTINGTRIEAVDPTLRTTVIDGVSARLAFDELTYELETSRGDTSTVTVRFFILPVQHWHSLDNVTKRQIGIVGGGGVSILRAGREIASGWHLMGSKRRENYDDWWRCEIEFSPCLDEHFGITINKQGIRPSSALREALERDLESVARLLNVRVRHAFEDVKFHAAAEKSCRIAEAAEPDLPLIASSGHGGAIKYRIGTDVLPMTMMFHTELVQQSLNLIFNSDHPAFAALYQPLQSIEGTLATELRTAIELFVLSFARTTAQLEGDGRYLDELLKIWTATYGRMLQKS